MSDSLADMSDDEAYVYMDEDGQVQSKIEIFLVWEECPSVKTMTMLSKSESLSFLRLKIVETMEKFSLFAGLTGLTTTSICKEDGTPLPERGLAGDCVKAGDVLTFALASQDLWVSAEIRCPAAGLAILVDAKVSFSLSVLKFRAQLFEFAVALLRSRGQDAGYTLNSFRVTRQRGQKSLSISSCSAEGLLSLRVSPELDDSLQIRDCFDYLSSYVTSMLEAPLQPLATCPVEDSGESEPLSPLFPVRKLRLVDLSSLEMPRKQLKRQMPVGSETCKGCTLL